MWITPVVKSTYTDASTLVVDTIGRTIRTAIDKGTNINQFVVKYYTWPDTMSMPSIPARSEKWAFMKQDSSRMSSSTLPRTDYTTTKYARHNYIEFPKENYVNEW